MSQTQHATTTVEIHATRCACFVQVRPCGSHEFHTKSDGYISMVCGCSPITWGALIGHYDSISHRAWFRDSCPASSRTCFHIPGSGSSFEMYSCPCLGSLVDLAQPHIGCRFTNCGCSMSLILCREHWIKDSELRRASPRSFEGSGAGPSEPTEPQEQPFDIRALNRSERRGVSAIQQIDNIERQRQRQTLGEAPNIPESAPQPQESTSPSMAAQIRELGIQSPSRTRGNVSQTSAASSDFDEAAVKWVPIRDIHEGHASDHFHR